MSQIAVPSPGVFYPGSLLYAFLPYSKALGWQMVINQTLSGLGMFLFIISLGWGVAPGVVAALIASCSGYMFSSLTNFTLAFTAAALPVNLWAFHALALAERKGDRRRVYLFLAVASLSVFLLLTAGRPEVFIPGAILLFLFVVLDGLFAGKRGQTIDQVRSLWLWQFLALLTGALLSLPSILPLAEWTTLSPQAQGLPVDQVLMWSANWYDLVSVFVPQPFGDLQVLGAQFLPLVCTRPLFIPFLNSAYVGPIALTLAIWAFFDRSWRERFWVALCLLISTLFCLGEHASLAPLLVHFFPLLSLLRYPIKWLIFPVLCLAIAAARGAYLCFAKNLSSSGQILAVAIWLIALLSGIALILLGNGHLPGLLTKHILPPAAELELGKPVVLAALIGLLTALAGKLMARKNVTAKLAQIIVVSVVAGNLIVAAATHMQMTENSHFYQGKLQLASWIAELVPKSKFRLLTHYFEPLYCPPDYRSYKGASWTASFYSYCRQVLVANTNLDTQTCETSGYEAGATGAYYNFCRSAIHRTYDRMGAEVKPDLAAGSDVPLFKLCQSSGTQLLATQIYNDQFRMRMLANQYFLLLRQDVPLNLRLYKVKSECPRAYFCSHWLWVDDQAAITSKLLTSDAHAFEPISLPLIEKNSATVVDKRVTVFAPKIEDAPDQPPFERDQPIDKKEPVVSFLQDAPEHVALSVAAPNPGFIILCDHFYPGWKAHIDGLAVRMYRANLEQRAVYLSKGAHLIEFDYPAAEFVLWLNWLWAWCLLARFLCLADCLAQPLGAD